MNFEADLKIIANIVLNDFFIKRSPKSILPYLDADFNWIGCVKAFNRTNYEEIENLLQNELDAFPEFLSFRIKTYKVCKISSNNYLHSLSVTFSGEFSIKASLDITFIAKRSQSQTFLTFFKYIRCADENVKSTPLTDTEGVNRILKTIIKNTPASIVLFKIEGNSVFPLAISNTFVDMFEISDKDYDKFRVGEFPNIYPGDIEGVREAIRNAISSKNVFSHTFRIKSRLFPGYATIKAYGKIIKEPSGQLLMLTGYENLTEIQLAKENEKNQIDRFRALSKSIQGGFGIFLVGESVRTVFVSACFEESLGYEKGELYKLSEDNMCSLIHPDDVKNIIDTYKKALLKKTSATIEYRIKDKFNRWRSVKFSANVVRSDHSNSLWYGVFMDLDKIENDDEKNKKLVDSLDGGFITFEYGKGLLPNYMYFSDGFCKALNCSQTNLIDKIDGNLSNILAPESSNSMLESLELAYKKMKGFKLSVKASTNNKDFVWIGINTSIHCDTNQNVFFYCICTCMTEMRLYRDNLRDKEQCLSIAVNNGNISYWEYYPSAKLAVVSTHLQKKYNCPGLLEDFPRSWLHMGITQPDSIKAFMYMHEKTKQGAREVSVNIQNKLGNKYVWEKIRYEAVLNLNGEITKYIGIALELPSQQD